MLPADRRRFHAVAADDPLGMIECFVTRGPRSGNRGTQPALRINDIPLRQRGIGKSPITISLSDDDHRIFSGGCDDLVR